MACFYLWSIQWSRKSGTEDLDSDQVRVKFLSCKKKKKKLKKEKEKKERGVQR